MNKQIALIGLGHIGKIHLRILCGHPQWTVSGIYDLDPDLTRELAGHYGIRAFQNLDEAIRNSDAVDIATTSMTHYQVAEAAIRAGKHVFVEKPVTSELNQARKLASMVDEAGVVCHVGHVERYNPAYRAALPFLENPQFFEVHRLAGYNPRGTDVSVVLDLMTHDLDLILHLVKARVKRIGASGVKLVSESYDLVNARIEFDNGCVANVTTNRMAMQNKRQFRVFTKDKFVNINLLDKKTEVMTLGAPALEEPSGMVIHPGNGLPDRQLFINHPEIYPTNAISEELSAFYNDVISNKATGVGIDEAVGVMALAFEIEEKLRS